MNSKQFTPVGDNILIKLILKPKSRIIATPDGSDQQKEKRQIEKSVIHKCGKEVENFNKGQRVLIPDQSLVALTYINFDDADENIHYCICKPSNIIGIIK